MISFHEPTPQAVNRFLQHAQGSPLSYAMIGMTRGPAPRGFNVDTLRHRLGSGDETFDLACAALRSWAPFKQNWIRLSPMDALPAVGLVVAITARIGPLWWSHADKVVYVLEEAGPPRRFGFAVGTLLAHAECGEERFMIEQSADGSVWYDLLTYSYPRHWLARLGYPFSRAMQKRFRLGSVAAMEHPPGSP